MSEAELHVLRARLRGGIVNKARRGELEVPLPVGFVYDAAGRVGLDPDRQVQETLRAFFQTFRRTGSATATVKAFRDAAAALSSSGALRRPSRRDAVGAIGAHARALGPPQSPLCGRVLFRAQPAAPYGRRAARATSGCRARSGRR